MKKKTWIVAIAAAAAVSGALVWAFLPRPVIVETATVERGLFEQTIDEDGKTRVRERYVISSPLAGRVHRITLKAGDAVEPGSAVAVLDPAAPPLIDARTERELQERVGSAEAAVARARTGVEQARSALAQSTADLKRTQKLAKEGFVSPAALERDELRATLDARTLEAAQFEHHAAGHQLELARAALVRSRQAVQTGRGGERLDIRAPVRGRVLRVFQESEAVVAIGAPLIELADPRDLEAVVDVLTSDAVHIAAGAPVRLEVANTTHVLEGRVRRVEPSAFTKVSALGVEEQRVNVVIDIVSPRERWSAIGDAYRVDARIVVYREENALRVPVSALFRDDSGWAVFVAKDDVARARRVDVLRRGTSLALIGQGVAEGERVIVYPGEALHEGARVRVTAP